MRVLAHRVAKIGKKLDRIQDKVKHNGLFILYMSIFGAGAFLITYGTWIRDTALPFLNLRESIHYSFHINDAAISTKTLDYKNGSTIYKFQVTVSNSGDAIGGNGRLLIMRIADDKSSQLVAASETQRSIDNMSLTIEFPPTKTNLKPSDLPKELLVCAWQSDDRRRVIPILSRLALEYASTANVRELKSQKRVGYAPYTGIPLTLDPGDPLTQPEVCEKAVKAFENDNPVKCVPFASPFASNCRPDDTASLANSVQGDTEPTEPPAVDPVVAAKTEMKRRLNESSEWVSCSNGICWLRELGPSLAAVKRIEIGTTSNDFERSIAVPDLSNSGIQTGFTPNYDTAIQKLIVLPNMTAYLRLIYFDGTQSAIRTLEDHSNYAGIRGVLIHEVDDKRRLLMVAFNPNRSEWSFLPLLNTDEVMTGYSLDSSGFYDVKKDLASQIWNGEAVNIAEENTSEFIRFQIDRNRSPVPEVLKFPIPTNLPDVARTANVMLDPQRLVECHRYEASEFRYRDSTTVAGMTTQSRIDSGRNANGYGFVNEPSVGCMMPQLTGAPTGDAAKVLQSIEFRTEPDSVRHIAAVRIIPSNPNLQPIEYMRNYAHAMMPLSITELYMTLIFKTGQRSREYRLKIPPHT